MNMDLGLLIIRLVVGLLFMMYGAQKLFGWFGGNGLKKTGGWMASLGIKPGLLMAFVVGLFEFAGGFFLAAGLLVPLGAALIVIVMLGAIFTVDSKKGYWKSKPGFEYKVVLLTVSIGIALIGTGSYSLGN